MDETSILLQSAAFKLTFAFAAVLMMWLTLNRLDKSLGLDFRDIIQHLREGNVAIAVYFGARIVAVALLIGMALG